RYLTLSAVIQTPTPRLNMNATATNTGNNRTCQPGMNWYQTIRITRIAELMRKSTKATITAAIGTINRGKYTLLMRWALPMRLFEASPSAVAKKLQGSRPANTISAYGVAPSEGSPANLPKMTVNTTVVRNGRMNAQAAPITVCL